MKSIQFRPPFQPAQRMIISMLRRQLEAQRKAHPLSYGHQLRPYWQAIQSVLVEGEVNPLQAADLLQLREGFGAQELKKYHAAIYLFSGAADAKKYQVAWCLG